MRLRSPVRLGSPGWLRVLAGLAVTATLVATLGAGAFLDGLRAVDVASVLAALGIGLLTTLLSAGRWCVVARGLGVALPPARAVADTYRALFLNSVLPAGVLGDVHRAVRHGRRDGGPGARAVVLERAAGQAVVLTVGAGLLLTQPALHGVLVGPVVAVVAVAAVLVGAVLVGALSVRAARIRAVVLSSLAEVRSGVLARGIWPGVVLLSVAGLAGHLALFVVAARTAGSLAPLAELLPLLTAALLAMALPFTVGGWGPREAVAAVGFGAAGYGAAQGLTVAVVYGVLGLVACLPGAALLLVRRRPARAPGSAAGEPVACPC